MTAKYPNAIYTPRTMVNRTGVTYEAERTKDIYAEDFNKDRDEIVAIENELGVNPKGSYATVKAWLTALDIAVGGIITTFLGLSDTPASYADQGGKVVAVNGAENSLEFIDAPSGDPLDAYPVGAIYLSVVSTSPATLFGGTWSIFGAGKCLVGIDSGDTDFDTVEETRGSKTHTLQLSETPAHVHELTVYENGTVQFVPARSGNLGNTTQITGMSTSSKGGGGAHNNIQPSIVVYMWKRTA